MSLQLLNQELAEQIERIARREQRFPVDVVAEALQLYEAAHKGAEESAFPSTSSERESVKGTTDSEATESAEKVDGISFLLSLAGMGSSGQRDISERDEEILAAEAHPIFGWSIKPHDDDSA